jgi:hypothetical protein
MLNMTGTPSRPQLHFVVMLGWTAPNGISVPE